MTVQWLGVWHSLGNQPARDVEAWSMVMQKHLKFDTIIINGNVVKPCYFKLKEDKISEDLLIKQVVGDFPSLRHYHGFTDINVQLYVF